jgi:hypothetical protein
LKVRIRSSATFFSLQFRNRFGCLQYCGIAEVRTKIVDAHLRLKSETELQQKPVLSSIALMLHSTARDIAGAGLDLTDIYKNIS